MTPLHNQNRRRCGLGVLLWVLWAAWRVGAAEPAAAFDAANKLYEQGKPAEAAQAFERLAQAGQTSGPLYFNLGNACFKAGQIGRAIAAYRQAELLAPRDPDARANLQFARKQVEGPTLAPRRIARRSGAAAVATTDALRQPPAGRSSPKSRWPSKWSTRSPSRRPASSRCGAGRGWGLRPVCARTGDWPARPGRGGRGVRPADRPRWPGRSGPP